MGFRFRKSISLAPGLRINLNKRSASLSVGSKHAHLTIGSNGTRETVSLGSGVSFTHTSHQAHAKAAGPARRAPVAEPPQDERLPVGVAWRGWVWLLLIVLILGALVVQAIR